MARTRTDCSGLPDKCRGNPARRSGLRSRKKPTIYKRFGHRSNCRRYRHSGHGNRGSQLFCKHPHGQQYRTRCCGQRLPYRAEKDAFTFFDAIVGGESGILYETAGALGQGERIFITAKLPNYIRIGNSDDVIEKYIFLTTSHDGSGSITAAFTPIRIVCQNTLNASLRNMSNVVRIKHTAGAKQRLNDAHKVMGLANSLTMQMDGIFNSWAKVKVKDSEIRKLIQLALCPNKETFDLLKKGADDELSTMFKNTVDDAFAYAMINDTQLMETTKGTLFGAYNAVTGYFQNVRNYKNPEAKLQSIVLGGTAQLKTQKAFELCTSFEKIGADVFELN